jgi:hypothetical protein
MMLPMLVVSFIAIAGAGEAVEQATPSSTLAGRWDLTILDTDGFSSAWLEILDRDDGGFQGRLVWLFGGAEPITDIKIKSGRLSFHHHFMGEDLEFSAVLDEEVLRGAAKGDRTSVKWVGFRAPALRATERPRWGKPHLLFNGTDLSGWAHRGSSGSSCWKVRQSVLFNEQRCSDLISELRVHDFQLHLEFKLEDGGGSGVYLRGRYEVQIADDAGKPPSERTTGAIFGLIAPSRSAAKPQGEWQSMDVILVGRTVTVDINGQTVISKTEIPGITGAALDSREETPGPIMLQGDHGRIAFRNIIITRAD